MLLHFIFILSLGIVTACFSRNMLGKKSNDPDHLMFPLMKGLQLVGTNLDSHNFIIEAKESVSNKWIGYGLRNELV